MINIPKRLQSKNITNSIEVSFFFGTLISENLISSKTCMSLSDLMHALSNKKSLPNEYRESIEDSYQKCIDLCRRNHINIECKFQAYLNSHNNLFSKLTPA